MANCRKTIALLTVMVFTLSVISAVSFAESEEVISYCERVDVPVMEVNLGGEDVTVDGAPFSGQRNVENIKTYEREPVEVERPHNTVNALSRIEAEDFTLNNGVEVEDTGDVDGRKNLSYISNGDYVSYEDIYFPKGTKGFIARVASDTEGGYIELRLNSPSGELVGRTRVNNTGDWQDYTEVYCELNRNVSGVHTLYLGFVGDREGLFNVNWFRFTKSAYDPVNVDSYDEKDNGAYKYNFMDFGEGGRLNFKADFSQKVDGTIDVRLGSPTASPIASIDASNESSTYISSSVKGVNELYLTDSKNGELISKMNWFVFEPEQKKINFTDSNFDKLFNTSIKGYTVDIEADLDKNNIYEIYIYPTEYHNTNRQVFDLYINDELADTIDMEENYGGWDRKGPYLTKVLDDGKLSIECKSIQGLASIAAVEINKVTYTEEFDDVNIRDWFYIPVMELASQGVIFGKGNDQFSPGDHIIGEHVAYMTFNVMKRSIAENDSDFKPERYRLLADISPDFWAYHYMSAYYDYFFTEKMLRYDLETRIPYSAEEYRQNRKVRREEFAMAIIGARRLDYNEDGRVFVLDPELEPGANLNRYTDKDADEITDSYRYFIELALDKGLMRGDHLGNLNPKDPVTRAEAAAFIYNALNLEENNFIKPEEEETLAVPRITAKKRDVNVGILILPAPAWDSINDKAVDDPNPDFTLLELLDRNINKPMDWVLVNPHPPAFDKSEYRDIMHLNSTEIPGIDNESFSDFSNYFNDLRSVAKAQTDLEADITHSGVVGYTENIDKSKFFKYWEVSIDDSSLTPEQIAKDYDILFQTSHGEISYPEDVQDKVKAFLNAGGQLWWENCDGLVIEPGDGFTEAVSFESIRPGGNIKFPQIPVLDDDKNMHPLFDNIFRIDPDKSTRVMAPGMFTETSEISLLGDGEEWLNDDNRYLDDLLPTDEVILHIEDTTTGEKLPNLAIRNIKNEDESAGRIVITTSDIGCGITKHVYRGGGKAVEDYKFCYNLFGWMSKVGVSFDETRANTWDGGNEFSIEATFTNHGARAQTYDIEKIIDTGLWEVTSTTALRDYEIYHPWIKELDDKGYPKKIELEPNQSEVVEYSLRIKTPDIQYYNFALRAAESGVENPRDTVETTFRLNNTRIEPPVFTGFRDNGFDVTLNAPEEIKYDLRTETYELYLRFEKDGRFIDPEKIFKHIQIEESNLTPELEGLTYNYMVDGRGNLYVRVTIDDVLFMSTDERIKLNVFLEDENYQVTGKAEVFDPVSRQRNSFSDKVRAR
ncbi:carbohydrate-binding protein [Herbivorax sp. ANBcel31]|uniref:carbohydrate-binding protein n=1 Tax=Herbivorax sp. ANBcel31 TaxID=3069754 RepID=UPI0027ADCAC9|nr:carbohydrate-binding protein [Herbivorax sp. ANBcel31]MDQ2085416.1 carbohydrate-binding protein [Herbivorax sp. ANBcel31]